MVLSGAESVQVSDQPVRTHLLCLWEERRARRVERNKGNVRLVQTSNPSVCCFPCALLSPVSSAPSPQSSIAELRTFLPFWRASLQPCERGYELVNELGFALLLDGIR
jgi:hypothetical protein